MESTFHVEPGDDGISCGGCDRQMLLDDAHDSANIDGRFRCTECREDDRLDLEAERQYDAERAAHALTCGCPTGGPKTSAECAPFAGPALMLILDHGETPPDTTTFQRTDGTIVTAARVVACRTCGFDPAPGADWSLIEVPCVEPGYGCSHMKAYRECRSCSSQWHRIGMKGDFDYDLVGDPGEYRGGAAHEECPDCIAHTGDDGHYHDTVQPARAA